MERETAVEQLGCIIADRTVNNSRCARLVYKGCTIERRTARLLSTKHEQPLFHYIMIPVRSMKINPSTNNIFPSNQLKT